MKHCFSKKLFYFLVAVSVFTACRKDVFDFSNTSVKIDGEWGVALVNTEAAFYDFTIDSALSIISDKDSKIVKVIYSVPLVSSGTLKEIFPVYDYQWDFSLNNIEEPNTVPFSDTVIYSGEQNILFYGDTDNILIDTTVLNKGNFQLIINNTLDHEVKFRIKSKYFHYSNGSTLDRTETIPYNATNYHISIDLTGCRVKLKGNALPCEIEIVAYNDGHPFLGDNKKLDVDVSGTLYAFHYLRGKVSSFSDIVSTKQDFSIKSENISFNVKDITGAKIHFNTLNGFGAGVAIDVTECSIITGGKTSKLLNASNSNFVFKPSVTPYQTVEQSFTIPLNPLSIAKNNDFKFTASGVVNEAGITGADVWVTDNSFFGITPSLELPLNFNLEHFIYRDTIAQEISKIENIDFASSMTLRIEIINDFPIELGSQLYFLDANFRVIDSVFATPAVINAASTDNNSGKTITAGKMPQSPLLIEVSKARLENIYKTKYISIYARAASKGSQQTIMRSDHKLKIKVGAKVNVKGNYKL